MEMKVDPGCLERKILFGFRRAAAALQFFHPVPDETHLR